MKAARRHRAEILVARLEDAKLRWSFTPPERDAIELVIEALRHKAATRA